MTEADAASETGCLCDQCAALCCRYFALPIDNPDCEQDYDNIRWYLLHEKVVVFVEDGQWFIGILNRCKALQPDNRCGVYETRPRICRGYSTDNCDYHAGDYGYEHLFTSADALWTFAKGELAKMAKPKPPSRRSAAARRIAERGPLTARGDKPAAAGLGPAPVAITGRSVRLPVAGG